MGDTNRDHQSLISWERARAILGHSPPPADVWERQFDDYPDVLQRLARTPDTEIDFGDLWYYHHDLAFVALQPELFRYLFPVCLMDWHQSLMRNQACSHGDSEFHYGVHQGSVFRRMLTVEQRAAVYEFFRDSFLERLDAERGFIDAGGNSPASGWLYRLNSVGIIMSRIDMLWEPWWSFETPGRAVAALEYCSGLMYAEGQNPLFVAWTPERGGGGPYLWENDSHVFNAGWTPENVDFLTGVLTVEFMNDNVHRAAARLTDEVEGATARRLCSDLPRCQSLIAKRVAELTLRLSRPKEVCGWSTSRREAAGPH